jgi:HEAT repeat protein
MPIRFLCPECNRPLSIGTRKAGMTVSCPLCKGEIAVPQTSNYVKPLPLEAPETSAELLAASLCLEPTPLGESEPRKELTDLSLPLPPPVVPPEPEPAIVADAIAAGPPAPPPLPAAAPVVPVEPLPAPAQSALPTFTLVAVLLCLLVVPALAALLIILGPGETREQARTTAATTVTNDEPAVSTPGGQRPTGKQRSAPPPLTLPVSPGGGKDTTMTPEPVRPELPKSPAPKEVPPPTEVKPPAPKEVKPPAPEPVVAKGPTWEEKWRRVRRSRLSDEDLRKQLLLVPEAALDAVPNSTAMLLAASRSRTNTGNDLAPLLMTKRFDLAGLKPRMGIDCRLGEEPAKNLQALSRRLRRHLEASIPGAVGGVLADTRPNPDVLRDKLLNDAERKEWLQPEAIPTLLQLLMAENKNVRLILVELLAQIPGAQASEALARRALFDLHPDVRQAAVTALKGRPREEYQDFLTESFRYPWGPIADHAAEALVMLEMRQAVPKLVPQLFARDVSLPFTLDGPKSPVVVRELVRINHLGNCLLCHAPSFVQTDLVRGRVPIPGQALPAPVTTPQYYEGNQGIFVRADITYLKQDFSVSQPVPRPGTWPGHQRYDYMVRVRPVTPKEAALRFQAARAKGPAAVGKEALMFALRELTGKDPGPQPEDWLRLFPVAKDATAPAGAPDLKEPLPESVANGGDEKPDDLQMLSRQAFAQFLSRLPLEDLRARLRDSNKELRHAAVLAAGLRKSRTLVPALIEVTKEADKALAQEAERILLQIDPTAPTRAEAQKLSGELADASAERQSEIIAAYRAGKGPAYDQALAEAIPNLAPAVRTKAREALQERLAKAPVAELRKALHEKAREIRYAAVLAAAQKKTFSLAPDLIALLNDADQTLVQQARQALRDVTGQDFGPEPTATAGQRVEAVIDWQRWWKRQAAE